MLQLIKSSYSKNSLGREYTFLLRYKTAAEKQDILKPVSRDRLIKAIVRLQWSFRFQQAQLHQSDKSFRRHTTRLRCRNNKPQRESLKQESFPEKENYRFCDDTKCAIRHSPLCGAFISFLSFVMCADSIWRDSIWQTHVPNNWYFENGDISSVTDGNVITITWVLSQFPQCRHIFKSGRKSCLFKNRITREH